MNSLKVKDYMTLQAVTFTKTMPLTAALSKVIQSVNLGGPVIDEDKKVVGFLSEQDLLDNLITASYYCQDTNTVEECMHKDVLSVSPDMSIIELADMMQVGKPKVYPVVDDNGKLVGVITRRDVLTAINKSLNECFAHPV